MMVHPINPEECRAVLARAAVGRLGCAQDNQPYVVPVYLAYEADYIYVFSTQGKKIEWMRANPKVCVEVDEVSDQTNWVTVIASGLYQELREPLFEAERAHARRLLEKRHHWWVNALAERRMQISDQAIAPLYFRIRIESMDGLRSLADATGSLPRTHE